jgi:transcriptional regulator with XRE-family HTH domain
MSLGNNIQYLRKINKLKQEQFAEKMGVSRQTVSRWESGEVTPELPKLVDMCSLFSCTMDELVRGDLTSKGEIYSEVMIRKVPAFRMAKYIVISQAPEDDVHTHMRSWGERSGLLAADPNAKLIGWDFPFVSQEQAMRFGMHGYAAAYVLPEGFRTDLEGVQYCDNGEADYAVITVKDPMVQPFERIPLGYKHIMDYMEANNIKGRQSDDVIGCFEHEYEKDGTCYMDIYICVEV